MQNLELFPNELEIDKSPQDDLEITTTMLYFSKDELVEFKRLAKKAIKIEFGQQYQQRGNLSDLLLKLLAKYDDKIDFDSL